MPIEDVDYLIHHSSEDSTTIFVDSGTRDRTHYPFPSEYVVDIQEPIRDVFGFDVLDAVMPNTIYNVDVQNNRIRMLSVDISTSSIAAGNDAVLSLEFAKLGFATPINDWLSDENDATYFAAVISTGTRIPSGTPPPLTATSDRYYALTEYRPMTGLLLTVPSSTPSGADLTITYCGVTYTASSHDSRAALQTIKTTLGASFSLVQSGTDIQPRGVIGSTALYDVVTYSATLLNASQFSSIRSASTKPKLVMTACTAYIEVGFYTSLTSLQTSVQTAFDMCASGVPVTIDSTSTSGINRQNLFKFMVPSTSRLMICPDLSTARGVLGFDTVADAVSGTFSTFRLGGATEPMYSTTAEPGGGGQVMISAGLINLLGVRYVTLRCAEIEQYMGNVGKYGPFSTGVGVFKLLGSNEVAQLRFDYVSLIRRPLHPIGRLRRLTLRFELPDGTLFDFKGINHQILFTIKYYTPDPRVRTAAAGDERRRYVLNPDYDPDFMRFMIRRDAYAARMNDLGFAEPDQDDDNDNEEDAEDEIDRDTLERERSMQDYVFGTGTSSAAVPVTAPFMRFGADHQNRVLESERRTLRRILAQRRPGLGA